MGGNKKIITSSSKIPTCEAVKFQKRDFWFSLYLGLEIGLLFFLIVRFVKPDFSLVIKGIVIPPLAIAIFLPIFSFIAISTAFKLGEKIQILSQIGKFGFVGVGNTLVDIFVLNFLYFQFSVPKTVLMDTVFYATSFLIAMTHSFYLNKFWTFQKKETKKTTREFILFIFISAIGLSFHSGIATIVKNLLTSKKILNPTLNANIGKLFGVMFSLFWDFTGFKLFVFKKNKDGK